MVARFFDHTKPNSFIVVCLITLTHFFAYKLLIFKMFPDIYELAQMMATLLFLVGNFWVINAIKNENEVTKHHNFTLFFFGCFIGFFPEIYNYPSVILANFFVLLTFFRLIKIENNPQQKKIIFDTSLFVFCAGILFSWAFLYIILVWLIALSQTSQPYRNSLIPVVALVVISVLLLSVALPLGLFSELISLFTFELGFSSEKYTDISLMFPAFFLVMVVWAIVFFYFLNKNKNKKSISLLLAFYVFITLIITIISEEKSTAEILLLNLPTCLLLGTQFENIHRKWIKESLLWGFILLPFVVFLLHINH